MLYTDYFTEKSTYTPKDFRRQFRMNKELFKNILHGVREYDTYFMMKKDTVGLQGFWSIQKFTAAMRMLDYRVPRDLKDEYICMSESTAHVIHVHILQGNGWEVWDTLFERANWRAYNSYHGTKWSERISWDTQKTSITCIGQVCIKGILNIAVWYLKLCRTMTSGFGILF
jgi:hypothetical protein